MSLPNLNQADLISIAKALADTDFGFTGSELSILIHSSVLLIPTRDKIQTFV